MLGRAGRVILRHSVPAAGRAAVAASRPACFPAAAAAAAAHLAAPSRAASSGPAPFERLSGRVRLSRSSNGGAAAAAAAAASKQPVSHKPPKRRLEAASLPLRNNPAPTRGPILQCIAHTTAERYDLGALALVLRRLGVRYDEVPEGDRERAFVIGPWKGRGGAERLIRGKDVRHSAPADDALLEGVSLADDMSADERDMGFEYGERGEVWVFPGGSFVTWGLTEEEGRAFLRDVIRYKGVPVEGGRLAPAECEIEEVDFVVDPDAETQILGNLIQIGRPPVLSTFPPSPSLAALLARYTLSLSLTRSSSLSVLENKLDQHIASVSTLPRALEKFGEQPLGRREVIRKIGELMVLRMEVNTRGLEETPEFYWSEPELEDAFDGVAREFEIKERIEAINTKIDYAQEVQNTLRALLTESSGHRMELIIILLIAVEVVIAITREGPELWHSFAIPVIEKIHSWIHPTDPDAIPVPRRRAAPVAPAGAPAHEPQPRLV